MTVFGKPQCGIGAKSECRLRAESVACKNFVDRNLTLSVCDHSSVALNHIGHNVNLVLACCDNDRRSGHFSRDSEAQQAQQIDTLLRRWL